MKITLADKFIAYLALFSGLTISAVAIWYSVAGLVSIFAAAVIPIIVMGVVLEVSKLIATVWLKLNWSRAPVFIRSYLLASIAILMLITSMGIFGFLSKAHSDAGLVSGDVMAKIAVYDEKIKTSKENIDANRKALKQMDEAVDQVMGRSTTETGADKAVAIRRAQAKERARLQSEIAADQKAISKLNEERAPIAAEVRKVEAEVGPIKYIANFIYGDNPDANVLEKAVTWVIIIIVVVFDPLAVILLLASQYSFQWFRKAREEEEFDYMEKHFQEVADELNQAFAEETPAPVPEEKSILEQHPYLTQPFSHFKNLEPMVYKAEGDSLTTESGNGIAKEATVTEQVDPLDQWNKMIEAAEDEVAKEKTASEILDEGLADPKYQIFPELQNINNINIDELDSQVQEHEAKVEAEKQLLRKLKAEQLAEESKKKSTYIIKDQNQQIKKTKE